MDVSDVCRVKVLILKKGLEIHRSKVPEALQPFHAHMESRYQEMKIVLEREYGIKVGGDVALESLALIVI